MFRIIFHGFLDVHVIYLLKRGRYFVNIFNYANVFSEIVGNVIDLKAQSWINSFCKGSVNNVDM